MATKYLEQGILFSRYESETAISRKVILLLIYSKSEQADVAAEEIKLVIKDFQKDSSTLPETNQE
uniref:Uncharacterized protein n=1 Tax=Tolypothrix bouteillei VB521301 TaxID=1479485 RepID=A0A0C1QVJ2_9CYAN